MRMFALAASSHAFHRFLAAARPSAGYLAMVKHLSGLVDCCHPYWMKVQRVLLSPQCKTAHILQHGFRTVFSGPQSLWNADMSANDWLLQVCQRDAFFLMHVHVMM
jgi:hypothetical protein